MCNIQGRVTSTIALGKASQRKKHHRWAMRVVIQADKENYIKKWSASLQIQLFQHNYSNLTLTNNISAEAEKKLFKIVIQGAVTIELYTDDL